MQEDIIILEGLSPKGEWIKEEINPQTLKKGLTLNKVLYRVAQTGELRAIELLLKAGADPNEITTRGKNALHIAVSQGHLEAAQLMVANGADIHIRDIWGASALFLALYESHEELALWLIEQGADIHEKRDAKGWWNTPLEVPVVKGLDRVVQKMIDLGVDLNAGNYLSAAIAHERFSIMEMLLKAEGFQFSGPSFEVALDQAFRQNEKIANDLLDLWTNPSKETLKELFSNAISLNSMSLVKKLLSLGTPANESDALEMAIAFSEEIALFLIEMDIGIDGWRGIEALNAAASQGQKSIVSALLAKGVNANGIDHYRHPPLFYAARSNHVVIVKMLIEAGADIDITIDQTGTALSEALRWGAYESACLLLDLGIKIEDQSKYTPLHAACERGFIDIAERLIDLGAPVNAKDSSGCTPLMLAIGMGHKEIIALLLKHGADMWIPENGGRTPFMIAVEEGKQEIARHLLTGIWEQLSPAQLGELLIGAILGKDTDLVYELIERGAPVDYQVELRSFRWKLTPLCVAVYEKNWDIAAYLLKKGANVNLAGDGITPLSIALEAREGKLAKLLIDYGAKPSIGEDSRLFNKSFGLHCLGLIEWLIDHQVDLTRKDGSGNAPLHYFAYGKVDERFNAAWGGIEPNEPLAIATLLVNHGADIQAFNREGFSPLHLAVLYEKVEMIRCLVSLGADVNLPGTRADETPLHLAATQECIDLLIELGADLEARDAEGFTPLHTAVVNSNIDAVVSFLDHGANIETRAFDGSTLIDSAKKLIPSLGIIEFLKRRGAPCER